MSRVLDLFHVKVMIVAITLRCDDYVLVMLYESSDAFLSCKSDEEFFHHFEMRR